MTDDEILQALNCEYPFPREALLAATANRATIAPRLIAEIDRYVAAPDDESNRPQRLFFAFHLLAEWREKAAYRPLCRLTRLEVDGFREVIGGALTETGPRVLASVFDGDPQPLYELIHDQGADEFARAMGCEALAMVSARGELPIGEAERFLRESFETLQPRDINFVWSGWQEAIGILGLESLAPLVRRAFDSFIDPTWTEYKYFEKDLHDALATGLAAAKGSDRRRTLFDDTVAELSGWHCFSEAYQRERRLAASRPELQDEPYVNPYRHVGRNDPCPCGSGLKFKRCHGKS
ncbi:MAG: DUF1186 domain-containing protein [Reyranellaceae bacterium]